MTLLLTACATTSDPTLVSGQPSIEVPTVVEKACVNVDSIPPVPVTSFRAGLDQRAKTAAAFADVLALEVYTDKLTAMLLACARKE